MISGPFSLPWRRPSVMRTASTNSHHGPGQRAALWAGLLVWVAVGLAATRWVLPWTASATPPPAQARWVLDAPPAQGDWSSLMGREVVAVAQEQAAPSAAQRFKLLGVIAGSAGQAGVALISMDGKPARAVRVGDLAEPAWRLTQVQARQATFTAAETTQGSPTEALTTFTLDLPAPPAAAQGTLPPVGLSIEGSPAVTSATTGSAIAPTRTGIPPLPHGAARRASLSAASNPRAEDPAATPAPVLGLPTGTPGRRDWTGPNGLRAANARARLAPDSGDANASNPDPAPQAPAPGMAPTGEAIR